MNQNYEEIEVYNHLTRKWFLDETQQTLQWFQEEKEVIEKELYEQAEGKSRFVYLIYSYNGGFLFCLSEFRNKIFFIKDQIEPILFFEFPTEYMVTYINISANEKYLLFQTDINDSEINTIYVYSNTLSKLAHVSETMQNSIIWKNDNEFYFQKAKIINDLNLYSFDIVKNKINVIYEFSKSNEFSLVNYYFSFDELVIFNYDLKSFNTTVYSRKQNEENSKLIIQSDCYVFNLLKNETYYFIIKNESCIDIVDINKLEMKHQIIFLDDEIIEDFKIADKFLVIVTYKNNSSKLYKFNIESQKKEEIIIDINLCSILIMFSNKKEIIFSLNSFTQFEKYYFYNFETNALKELKFQKENEEFEINIKAEIAFAEAHDGELIPISILTPISCSENIPFILLSYGGYAVSMKARMDITRMYWLKKGYGLAIAHVRGGGEKGEKWHREGSKFKKATTWLDIVSSAEFLINKKFTSSSKLSIIGKSLGGLSNANAMLLRPNLFNSVVLLDPLLNLFDMSKHINNYGIISEIGDFKMNKDFLLSIDPFYNLEMHKNYPPTLITAGLNDARVPAWQAGKFHAKLKNYGNKSFLKVDFEGGHGLNINDRLLYDTMALTYSFIEYYLKNNVKKK